MIASEFPRVLCVDDEPGVLDALVRTLRKRFQVTTAVGPNAGLRAVEEGPPFAVVISDLRMPGSDGVNFLAWVRELAPDTVRILLTGQADVASAIAAVNDGAIFRFLTKPCPSKLLLETIDAAVERNRKTIAERTLLEATREGSLRALGDVLALVRPAASQRASRIRALALEIADAVGMEAPWHVEVAAALSQLGALAIPARIEEKLAQGDLLTPSESYTLDHLPEIASQVVANLPDMDRVREILALHRRRFDGSGAPGPGPVGKEIPLGARILKLAIDFIVLETRRLPGARAIEALRGHAGRYDPDLLDHLSRLRGDGSLQGTVVEIDLRAIRPGMVLAEDVRTSRGVLLVPRGKEATRAMVERIRSLEPHVHAKQRVCVIAPQPVAEAIPGALAGAAAYRAGAGA